MKTNTLWKWIISLAFILGSAVFTQAQTYLGFRGGLNSSTIYGSEETYNIYPVSGKSLGISLDNYISKSAILNFSLLLDDKGYISYLGGETAKKYGPDELRYSYKYLTLPVLLKVQGKGRLFASAGFGFYTSVLWKVKVRYFRLGHEYYDGEPLNTPSSALDVGIITEFGLGYRISEKIQLKSLFHLAIGLTSFKNNEDFYRREDRIVSNLSVNASLGVFIRLNKSEEQSK